MLKSSAARAVLRSDMAKLGVWGKQKDVENLLTDEKLNLSLHAGPGRQAQSMLKPKVVMLGVGSVGRSVEEWKNRRSGRIGGEVEGEDEGKIQRSIAVE